MSWETGSERIRELLNGGELGQVRPSGDDVRDAIRVAREVNDAAGKILPTGILAPW